MSPSPRAFLRAGIVVPRYGHSAVQRNRLKRQLRELVRLQVLPLQHALDVVFWAQRSAYEASFVQLTREIGRVVQHATRVSTG